MDDMLKAMMSEDKDEPPSRGAVSLIQNTGKDVRRTPEPANTSTVKSRGDQAGLLDWVKGMVNKNKSDTTLREAVEEFIEESANHSGAPTLDTHEGTLLSNVIELRDLTVVDVMIPRVDIIALDISTSQQDLLQLLAEKQFSRIPLYRESLDDVVGTIHIKDILSCLARGESINIESLVREVPIVAPSLPVLDLIVMMKQMRKHMALVVDEYGGIDGLVTIGDVIEAIIGTVDDEHDSDSEAQIVENKDGSLLADARYDIEDFEDRYGSFLTEEEREDIDTLGGLLFAITGRVPARGEVIAHPTGIMFEVLDADPRRVNKLLIRNIPLPEKRN